MKKEKNLGKPIQMKKHPFRQKFMAGLLCICLMLVSLPAEFYGSKVLAEGPQQKVLSFSPLPKDVELQTVGKGTDLEALNLPDTLTAVCVPWEEESAGMAEDSNQFSDITAMAGQDLIRREGSEVTPSDSTGSTENVEHTDSTGTADDTGSVGTVDGASTESGSESSGTAKEETLAVGPVTWESLPEYDSETEGAYVFLPVLPENYKLSEQAELPKITVMVKKSEEPQRDDGAKKRKSRADSANEKIEKKKVADEPLELNASEEVPQAAETAPACGEIKEDTVWGDGELSAGTLTVHSGVTLTVNGTVSITGAVTIQGGGTIARGTETASIVMNSGQELHIYGVTLDGKSIGGTNSFLNIVQGSLELGQGCVVKNVKSESAISIKNSSSGIFNDTTIIGCSANYSGGAVKVSGSLTVNGGTYQNNTAGQEGGVIYNAGNLIINGGNFIDNSANTGGGIYSQNNLTVCGGYFEGNNSPGKEGGAIFYTGKEGSFYLYGDVKFWGVGNSSDSYEDSVCSYLLNAFIFMNSPLLHPVNIYVAAREGNAVLKGNENYTIKQRDMKKFNIFQISAPQNKWYHVLDERNNQICITQTPQVPDSYNIFYDSNRGQGTVPEDEKDYQNGEDAVIQSGDTLSLEGYTFEGWNTKRDGTGTPYLAGTTVKMTEDLTLYAIFKKNEDNTSITADFYSGEAGKRETVTAEAGDSPESGRIVAPQLQDLPGWAPVGWSTSPEGYVGDILAGSEITLSKDTSYYGIYQREICLSYQMNGAESGPEPETQVCSANVHQEITYEFPIFTIAFAPERPGYLFQGWNTKEDGNGETYPAGSSQQLGSSMILYAVWENRPNESPDDGPNKNPDEAPEPVQYTVEHYKQELEGDGYAKEEGDTETLLGEKGATVEAKAKDYQGFFLNTGHPSGKISGTAEEGLVLKLYYDRDIYEIDFDLNGGSGTSPETQKIRWGGLLKEVPDPARAGYHFKGWHLSNNGLDGGLWDFGHPVENNTGNLHTTLYAMWADETAPVLGEASYSTGHKNFLNWIIQQDSIIITVPVTEEGSGLAKAEYVLAADDETEKEGNARIEEKHSQAEQSMAYGSSGSIIRALQGAVETGAYEAIITVEEEFKGKIYLTCTDKDGNESARKIITSLGGGIIIEDNAPEISFSNTKEKVAGKDIKVNVRVEDAKDGSVSGGLARVSYQLDEADEIVLPEQSFQEGIVESYKFTVKVSGAGEHVLWVDAVDNAGNSNAQQVTINISKKKKNKIEKEQPENPEDSENNETPFVSELPGDSGRPGGSGGSGGSEPKTGDSTHIQIYATAAMIAGFSYLLLYFEGEHGITESEKEEIVYRLVSWAKKGGRVRRMLGLAAIFFFLAYYHSIGKSVPVEWREVYKCPR